MKRTLYILAAFGFAFALQSCSKDGATDTPTPPVANTPGKAVLVAPENNKACETVNTNGQVVFTWDPATHTDSYDLVITNLNTMGTTYHKGLNTTNKAVTLTKGEPYSWSVISKNQGKETNDSDTWKFYLAGEGTSNYAPFPATSVSPVPGATIAPDNGKVTITWAGSDADNDPLTYTLEADTIDGLQGNKVLENSAVTSFDLSVQNGKVYYWRVISSDGEHTSTSVVYSFRTSG